ncbi:MAG: hypothetical protein WBO92_04465, partial [Candidatus Moraniibacteriota bacterium]
MTTLFLPILSGALAYALVQFLWYSPFLFGSLWRLQRGLSAEAVSREATGVGWGGRTLTGIVVPALLVSMSLIALSLVLSRVGLGSG